MGQTVIIDVQLSAEDASKKAKDLAASIRAIKDEQSALKKSGQDTSAAYAQNAQQLRTLQAEQKSYITLSQSEVGSNNQLRAQLALLTQQYNALGKSERDTGLEGKALTTQIRAISDELKVNEGVVGDNRRNVGNYRDTFKSAKDEILNIVPGLSDFSAGLNATQGIIKTNVTALGLLKGALVSTGIGAIVILLGSLVAYFTQTEEGSEMLERGLGGLKESFKALISPLVTLGKFLVNIFVDPLQAMKDFGSTVASLFNGKAVAAVKNYGAAVKDSFNAGANIAKLAQDAEDINRELNKQASKARADAAVLRAKGDAESLKAAEALLRKADQLSQQAVANEIKAQSALIKQREKVGQARDADYDKLNELYAKQDQSRQTDAAKAEKINTRLEKLAAAKAKAAEEAAAKELAANNELADSETRLANLRTDSRTAEQASFTNDIDQKIVKYKDYSNVVEALTKEREAKLLALQEGYRREDLRQIEGYLDQINDLTLSGIQNTDDRELLAFELQSKKKLDAINRDITATKEQIAKGNEDANAVLVTQSALRDSIVLDNANQRRELLKKQYDIDTKAADDLENQKLQAQLIMAGENQTLILEANQALLDAKYAQDIAAAERAGTDTTLIAAKYIADQAALNKAKDDSQLQSLNKFGDAFQQIQGKNSDAAKAAADVAARIDAAQILRNNALIVQEQVKAIVSQGKLIFPLNIGAIFATVAALTAGVLAAKKIGGFADGVIGFNSDGNGSMVTGAGDGRSDSINARLSNGESVINARSTKMFAPLLNAINVAGGGRSLAPGYAMADGGLSAGSYVSTAKDRIGYEVDFQNAIIQGFMLAPAPVVEVKEIIRAEQKVVQVRANSTI